MNTPNLSGKRFGKLLVEAYLGDRVYPSGQVHRQWQCLCDCGRRTTTGEPSLLSGKTRSCGCLRRESNRTHGMYRSSIYRVWWNMVQRCTNSKHSSYRYYGGRGITICARWMEPNGAGFRNFVADMGAHPGKGYSIDRINNDGHYEPGNCRWVTRSQQASNTRSTSLVTIRGRTMPVEAWCKVYGILPQTVWTRVARGIPVEKAITTPAKRRLALTVDGERKPVARWAREHGLDPRTVANRIRKGWKLSDAATTPVRDARSQRFTHRGKTLRLKEWSRALGIGYTTLRWRVAQGWPIEKVLTP